MCIGIPMRVVSTRGFLATCEGRGRRDEINVLLIGEVQPGQWLLTSLGTARDILDDEQAARLNHALDALEAMQRGETDFDAHFADLVGREPVLPPGLACAKE